MGNCDLFNEYGPTECSVWSTVYKHEKSDEVIQSIGEPISNTQVYITNATNELQPLNVIGEICIGGAGLARGYLNRPELTAEKFVSNPFVEGERMYKAGDLGRWLSDGSIEFIGRKDDQVKIRGYRIELGEIENTLHQNALIDVAVVLAREDANGDKNLVAYLMSNEELISSELRKGLSKQLPDYMLPAHFVQIGELPFTPNGKIDKQALPSPKGLGMSTGMEYVAPRNEVEEKLVGIWEAILSREKIGIKDSFFELGGHSLKAVKLIARVQQDFEVKMDLKSLFLEPTIENTADYINTLKWVENKAKNADLEEEKLIL
jgi:acyl carrier protein